MSSIDVAAGDTVHATAIIVGQTGLLFLGPSGSGKSRTAFACLAEAATIGWHAALVADDRTRLEVRTGRCIASCPESIGGLIELRGTGIVPFHRIARALIHCAVAPTESSGATRIPAENETLSCGGAAIPLMRLWRDDAMQPLSMLRAARPELFFAPAKRSGTDLAIM